MIGRVDVATTGTMTFLFTDLEGSTRLWEDHHDKLLAMLWPEGEPEKLDAVIEFMPAPEPAA